LYRGENLHLNRDALALKQTLSFKVVSIAAFDRRITLEPLSKTGMFVNSSEELSQG
jgi:hypothetical protein